MDLEDKNKVKFSHKAKGIKCCHTKQQAMKDISLECGNGKFYSKNYIMIEYIVLRACSCKMIIFRL